MWPVRRELRIWSHLLKKSLMENLIFCARLSSFTRSWKFQDHNSLENLTLPEKYGSRICHNFLLTSSKSLYKGFFGLYKVTIFHQPCCCALSKLFCVLISLLSFFWSVYYKRTTTTSKIYFLFRACLFTKLIIALWKTLKSYGGLFSVLLEKPF